VFPYRPALKKIVQFLFPANIDPAVVCRQQIANTGVAAFPHQSAENGRDSVE
jgi:hypothetical protein